MQRLSFTQLFPLLRPTTRALHCHKLSTSRLVQQLTLSMATPYRIVVPSSDTGLLSYEQNEETASRLSELLQQDLDTHHVFFNDQGYHNHISHQLLTLYGTGAGLKALETGFAANTSYQRQAMEPQATIVDELRKGWAPDSPYLGKGKHYPDFLKFFQDEMEKKGWQDVVKEYVFNGDPRSDDLFGRLFSGFLHPMIQLMFGIEWQQPAIIAEGLAEAAAHDNIAGEFLAEVEKAAQAKRADSGAGSASKSNISEMFEKVSQIDKLRTSAQSKDNKHVYDGVLVRARPEAIDFLKQVAVAEDELEERTAEMFHAIAYVATTAAFNAPDVPKMEFLLIHHLTSAPFFLSLNKLSWVPLAAKARLLEWKIRLDIIQYITRDCLPLHLEKLKTYTPKETGANGTALELNARLEDLLPRFHNIVDDGHIIKVFRSMLLGQQLSRKHAGKPWIRIADDKTWLKAAYMLVDGTEANPQSAWMRSAGFEQQWKDE